MASEKITALVEQVKELTVLELSELVHTLEEVFGVSALIAPRAVKITMMYDMIIYMSYHSVFSSWSAANNGVLPNPPPLSSPISATLSTLYIEAFGTSISTS